MCNVYDFNLCVFYHVLGQKWPNKRVQSLIRVMVCVGLNLYNTPEKPKLWQLIIIVFIVFFFFLGMCVWITVTHWQPQSRWVHIYVILGVFFLTPVAPFTNMD